MAQFHNELNNKKEANSIQLTESLKQDRLQKELLFLSSFNWNLLFSLEVSTGK